MSGELPADTPPALQRLLADIQRRFQRQEHKVFDREPFDTEIPEGGIVVARISGTSYIYSKVEGVRGRVALTDRP